MYGVLPARASGYHLHVIPEEAERGIRPPGSGVTEPVGRGWGGGGVRGSDLGTEPRPSVRAAYELSLQPLNVFHVSLLLLLF